MSKHYVGTAGLIGCLPNLVMADTNRNILIDSMVDAHMGSEGQLPRVKTQLRQDWYVEIDLHEFGNEYIEVGECDCGDIRNHFDEYDGVYGD